ncbi:MAG: queuosine precursor transporter [Sphingomonadales bacterium]|nr:queuosine precursor transporter [Sphingomonadales bacterium]
MLPPVETWALPKIRLFLVLGFVFLTNALLAEFIGVKIFSLNTLLGFDSQGNTLEFNLTAGVLLWPVVFVMTDLINEYYGQRVVLIFSALSALCILYAFAMVYGSIALPPAGFWPGSMKAAGVENMQTAYGAVFGQGLWIIAGSIMAFLVGQLVDVYVFQRIKRITGERKLWLRATGSTMISQGLDSVVVLYIAFYLGADWPLSRVLQIALLNYAFKWFAALAMTPLIYAVHRRIEGYLGAQLSEQMRQEALSNAGQKTN